MRTSTVHRLSRTALLAAAWIVTAGGCGADPRGILDGMSRTYRTATGYSDAGVVRIRYVRDGTEVEQTVPFQVVFQRPDRLRIDAYDARIAVDGTTLRGAVGNVPGQVLEEAVQSPLSLEQVFADEQIRLALAEGDAGCPTQLPLLLADDTIDLILADAIEKPRVTGTERVEGHECTVLTIPKEDGPLVLWIDRRDRLLRRLSLPTRTYAQYLAQQGGPVGGLAVIVDFVGATFRSAVPEEAFAFEIPPGAGRVARLEPPSAPEPPSPLIGRPCPQFALATLDGVTVTQADLSGTAAVLEFFFTECEPCRRAMPLVAAAVESRQASVKHYAVSVDDSDVSAETIRETVASWEGRGTILRDPRSVAAAAFGITTPPAVVVLAPDGTVADVQSGRQRRVGEDVAADLAAIAAGGPTVQLVRNRFESRLAEYREQLERISGGAAVERLPEQVIAPRRQPDRFKLVRSWRAEGIAIPGNVVCLDGAGPSDARIVALDGWRTVVVLDGEGKEIGRHELDLPSDAAVGFLRTAVDTAGRRWWLGGNRSGQQVFVFDDAWNLEAAYPGWESPSHAGVAAAELADLDGDGTPEIIVAYRGAAGVHAANLSGHRLWSDRSLESVADLTLAAAAGSGRRGILCVDGRGRLVPVAPDGVVGKPRSDEPANATPFRTVVSGPVAPDGGWAILGLAGGRLGQNVAVGVAADGEREWSLDLPDGVHRDGPIEPVAWADLLGTPRRQWLIAAPDGSVIVAWADGRVVDRYRHGAALTGIGGYRAGGTGFIVIATRDAVEGYRMDDVALD